MYEPWKIDIDMVKQYIKSVGCMANSDTPVIHVWCFRCTTGVKDTYLIYMFYTCNT